MHVCVCVAGRDGDTGVSCWVSKASYQRNLLMDFCVDQPERGTTRSCWYCLHLCKCVFSLCSSVQPSMHVCIVCACTCACWKYMLSLANNWTWGCEAAAASPVVLPVSTAFNSLEPWDKCIIYMLLPSFQERP